MKEGLAENNVTAEVGRFFVDLAGHLTGADKSENVYIAGADMVLWRLDAMVEVKGRDNNHRFAIDKDQLREYLKQLNFLSRTVYFLFGYKNRNGGKAQLFLKTKGRQRSIRSFLAKHLSVLYVLDAEAVEAIGRTSGEMASFPMTRERRNYGISRRALKKFFNGSESLEKSGLDSQFFLGSAEIKTRFAGRQIGFPIWIVLRSEPHRELLKLLAERKVLVLQRSLFADDDGKF